MSSKSDSPHSARARHSPEALSEHPLDYARGFIRDVPDFPKPGILFKDITPLLADPRAFHIVLDSIAERYIGEHIDAIVGVEARGFIFGGALAARLNASFVPARKPGKLPAAAELVRKQNAHVVGFAFVIELSFLGGRERLLPIKAGQCFGKPRGYDCSTQILNTGSRRMVFLDIGTTDHGDVDLGRYPEHGEILARFAGHRWIVPTAAVKPGSALFPLYESRYFRSV